ncbi:glucose 1-dehydrogenase [Pseudonocardia xishanensis]|uniref:3-oxoacyl-[acyl-carrier-protein] reductase n=1 Tax=Pseudonocardia xishanensis TaxID=630995 RepID=A0ABP8RU11_9PSEU
MPDSGPTVVDLFRLDHRVALVSGASGGLGAGFALALAEAGADVVLAARRLDGLEKTAAAVRERGRRALPVATDVTDPAACQAVAQAAIAEFGRLDVLVNNAGITSVVPALKEDPAEFRRVVDVNLVAAYQLATACARVMEHGGSIVNVASVLGLVKSVLPQAAYAASKAGMIGLTRDLAHQWTERRGIRVNALAPGFVTTDMTSRMPPEILDRFLATASMPRLGTQREIDAPLIFLASPASSYITGITVAVDGGMSGH